MYIKKTATFRPNRNIPTNSQELTRARKALEDVLKRKKRENKRLIKYVKLVAELKIKDRFEKKIGECAKEISNERYSAELIRQINLSIYQSGKDFSRRIKEACERICKKEEKEFERVSVGGK
jgi:hypothetical protein